MEITTERFYIIGIICFSVVFITSWINYAQSFFYLTTASKVGNAFSSLFNLALVGFFIYLYRTTRGSNSPEMESAIDDFKAIEEKIL